MSQSAAATETPTKKRSRIAVALALTAALLGSGLVVTTASGADESPNPQVINLEDNANYHCGGQVRPLPQWLVDKGHLAPPAPDWQELKIEESGTLAVPEGTYTDGTLTVEITASNETTATWTSNIPVRAVYFKAGGGSSQVYLYDSPGGTSGAGQALDHANNISHLSFCYDPPQYGNFQVNKVVDGEGAPASGTTFEVQVTCGTDEPVTVVFDAAGNPDPAGSNTFSDILAGTECTVTETNDGGADSVSYDPGQTVTVLANDTVSATVTNTFLPRGDIRVLKDVTGEGSPDPEAQFTIEINCGAEGFTSATFNHLGELTSPAGSNELTGLLAGTQCNVTETGEGDADSVSYDPGQDVEIGNGDTVTVTVSNDYLPRGNIEVVKVVDGEGSPDSGAEFTIDINCGAEGSTSATFNHLGELTSAAGSNELTGLLADTQCTVTETNDGGADHVSINPESPVAIVNGQTATVTVTNTFDIPLGGIEVLKVVDGEGAPDPGAEFTIGIDCGGDDTTTATFNPDGSLKSAVGSNELTDLEEGTDCTVTETDDGGADSVSYDPGQNVTIEGETTVTVTVTNTFDPKGDIRVVKVVDGEGSPDPEAEFVVDIDCDDDSSASATFNADGTLKSGSNELTGLLAGTECTVTEEEDGDADSVSISPESPITIEQDETAVVTVTNTFDPKGDIRVLKALDGEGSPEPGTEFVIELDCGDAGSTTAIFDEDGELISAEGSNELTDVLADTECTVTETNDGDADSVSYDPGQNVSVEHDELVTVTVTNTFLPRGDIEVVKVLAGEGSPEPGTEFVIELDCLGSDPVTATFDAEGELIDGENELTGLLTGTLCEVTETEDGGADEVSYDPSQFVLVGQDNLVTATVTNTFLPRGDIEVLKAVEGEGIVAADTEFEIELACEGEETLTATFDAEGELIDGENGFTDLLTGTECTVTETNDGGADDVSYDPGQEVVIGQDELATVTVTNTFEPEGAVLGTSLEATPEGEIEGEVEAEIEGEVLSGSLEAAPEGEVLSSALGGDLPRTGIFVGLLLLIAAGLLTVGAGMKRLARRR